MATALTAPRLPVDRTNTFYREHAQLYRDKTIHIDMSAIYDRFIPRLPSGARILDAGSGSGRDTLAFLRRGFYVDAFDASPELSTLSTALTGNQTSVLRFQEFHARALYDGVWACASLLHVPKPNLSDALRRLIAALKPGGVFYMSFKQGTQEHVSNDGRYFLEMDKRHLRGLLAGFPLVSVADLWSSAGESGYAGKGEWLNVILQKVQA